MRYSVVLPRIEATDADAARRALDSAHELWTKGDQRAALEQVKHAAESANATGQRDRALALGRAVTMLARAIGASSPPAPLVSEAPAVSASRPRSRPGVSSSADTEPPANGRPTRGAKATPLTKPSPAPAKPVAPPTVPAPKRASSASSGSAIARVTAPPVSGRGAPHPAITLPVAPLVTTSSASIPSTSGELPAASLSSTPEAATASASLSGVPEATEEADLVVTIAPSDWALPSPNALVGHSAQRVAVAPGRGPGGTLMVRPLAPGEVAPKGSIVAVMVALEPGPLPLPRAG